MRTQSKDPTGPRNYSEPINILRPRLRLTDTLPHEVCLDFRRPSGMRSNPGRYPALKRRAILRRPKNGLPVDSDDDV